MRRIAVGLMVGALVLAGCGGGSDDGAGAGEDDAPDAADTGGTERPEGAWTFVRTQLERSDAPDLDPGLSFVQLTDLDPSCSSGPCDIEVAPAGSGGSYLPEGLVVIDPAPPEPQTLVWDEDQETYTSTTERETSCTTAEGKQIDAAYRVSTVATVSFVPPEGDEPARFEGTFERTVSSTPTGEAAGCTSYDEAGTYVGSPTGALEDMDLSGEYVTTEYVSSTEPPDQRPAGFAGLLPPMTVDHAGASLSVTGLLDVAADLEGSGGAWSGSTAEVERPCIPDRKVIDGYTSVETWTDLAPVAVTADGDPILAGVWSLEEEPTDAGRTAGCTRSSNTGYVVMVPTEAVS